MINLNDMEDNLEKLINNGFDFLEKAIDQFKDEPKFSVINFCIATELFLKARLMKEHWSLVVSGNPDINSFKRGDFKSINFKDIIPKIEGITGEKFEQQIKACFDGLANHRNKMVHFYHDVQAGNHAEKEIKNIVIEQCWGWHYLGGLLEKWNDIFEPYKQQIINVNRQMKKHGVYLEAVFQNFKPQIDSAIKRGTIFIECQICKNKSSEVSKLTDYLFSSRCWVCNFSDEMLRIPCQDNDCRGIIKIDGYCSGQSNYECPDCGQELSSDELSRLLDDEPATFDNYTEYNSMNCAECGVGGEVVKHDEYYICLSCLYVDSQLSICRWCSEGQIGGGDLEFSGVTGCSFCDGSKDWHRDD